MIAATQSPKAYQLICILFCFKKKKALSFVKQYYLLVSGISNLIQYLVGHFHSPETIHHANWCFGIV